MDHLDDLGWVDQHTYRLGELEFGIRSTARWFLDWLDHALTGYRTDGEARPEFSIVVAENDPTRPGNREFHILYRGTIAVIKTFHLPTLVRSLLSEMESILLPERDDAIYTNATVVNAAGMTALMPTSLVSYVSALGRKVARAGVSLPANTAVAIDPDSGRVTPIRPKLRLADDALDRLAELVPADGEPDRFVIDEPLDVDAVCFIAQTDAGMPVMPMSPGRAVYRLADHVVNLRKLGGMSALEGLARMVRRTPHAYELDAAAPKDVLAALASLGPGTALPD